MTRTVLTTLAVALVTLVASQADAQRFRHAHHNLNADHANRTGLRHARGMPWHGEYYHPATGTPIALIVPPNAHMQTEWGWGVGQNTMSPIYQQFYRAYNGGYEVSSGVPLSTVPSSTYETYPLSPIPESTAGRPSLSDVLPATLWRQDEVEPVEPGTRNGFNGRSGGDGDPRPIVSFQRDNISSGGFLRPPAWPSSTRQFGVTAVRGPTGP